SALGFLQPAREILAFALESLVLFAQPLHQRRRAFHALGQPVQIGVHRRKAFSHRSLSRPPHSLATAAVMRSWTAWTSVSSSVRSGCWNWSANARLLMPSGVPCPA